MKLTLFDVPSAIRHEISQLSGLPRRPFGYRQWASQTTAPYVRRRCSSRLTKHTTTAVPAKGSLLSTQPRRAIQRPITLSASSRNYSSNDSKAPQDPPTQPSSLPSHTESLRSPLSHRFTHLMDNLQGSLLHATQHLNTLTGYSGIESLKASIAAQESRLQSARDALVSARTAYSAAIKQRSTSQREVNELLQRKHIWSPADLERFTELYRSDHANELNENKSHEALVKAEKDAEEAGAKLSESILAKYHEEQIWSDKIRRMSTWGTWGLMGVNVLLFLVFQIGVEPWRRRRLVKGFEEKVQQALERERDVKVVYAAGRGSGIEGEDSLTVQPPSAAEKEVQKTIVHSSERAKGPDSGVDLAVATDVGKEAAASVKTEKQFDQEIDRGVSTPNSRTLDYTHLKAIIMDLFSDRQVSVRKWDLTTWVLEGAASGMIVVGLIAAVLLRPK
ncbi:MAG: hypothetical protein LQ339_002551 [Xanthoria mediterranea]|nr:MAG: hypothetical protein LQ339_002551 [Xanthoria mediterranea]